MTMILANNDQLRCNFPQLRLYLQNVLLSGQMEIKMECRRMFMNQAKLS